MAPMVETNNFMIEMGNMIIACNLETAATQFNSRLNTIQGLGDLIYSLLYFPVEGMFIKFFDNSVDNLIWNSMYNLW